MHYDMMSSVILTCLEDITTFVRPLVPLFGLLVTSAPGFKIRVDPIVCASSTTYNGFLRFTSGMTPVNIWTTGIAVNPFYTLTCSDSSEE